MCGLPEARRIWGALHSLGLISSNQTLERLFDWLSIVLKIDEIGLSFQQGVSVDTHTLERKDGCNILGYMNETRVLLGSC